MKNIKRENIVSLGLFNCKVIFNKDNSISYFKDGNKLGKLKVKIITIKAKKDFLFSINNGTFK